MHHLSNTHRNVRDIPTFCGNDLNLLEFGFGIKVLL